MAAGRKSAGAARSRRRSGSAKAAAPVPSSPARRAGDLAFLLGASQALTRSLDLADVLSSLSRSLIEAVPASRVGVLLRETHGGESRLRLAAGSLRDAEGVPFPRDRILDTERYPEVQQALRALAPVEVDVAHDTLGPPMRDALGRAGVRRLLVLPLVVQDRCLGVLSIAQGDGDRRFTARERALVQAVANQAAVAIRNAQLFSELQSGARELERKVDERTRKLRESHRRLAVLNEVTAAVNVTLDLTHVLEAALRGLERLENVDRAQAYLVRGAAPGRALEVEAHELARDGSLRSARVPLAGGSPESVLALGGHPVRIGGAPGGDADPRSHLLAPLVSKDGVIGALQVFCDAPGAHGDEDLDLLQQVAGEISIAIERADLTAAAEMRTRQFEAISDIGRRLTQAVALEDMLPFAAQLVRTTFGYSLACILTIDERTGELVVAGADAHDPQHARRVLGHRQPADSGLCGLALREERPVNVADTSREPSFLPVSGLATRSELVVPILAEGRALGVVDLQSERHAAFGENDVAVMRMIADQLAAALVLADAIAGLQRGRAFTEQVMNNLTAGLIVTDRRRIVQIVNARAAEILAIRADELVGRDLLEPFPTAEPLLRYSYESVGRECELTLRDGSRIPLGYSNAFFVDTVHERDAVIITFRDLSEVRELQRKVRHAERLATIGTVAAGVAHEIRNPLFGISATAQIMARELPPDSPLAELCRDMLDETRRLNDLVSSLVAYGRPHELKLRTIDPAQLLADAVQAAHPRALEAEVTTVQERVPGTEGRTLEADPDQLKQVLLNLLLNAYDAAPGTTVTTGVEWDASSATLWVRDEGPGIPAKDLERVFDLFFTTKSRGSGLGLAITSRIVQDHGGVIAAVSPAPGPRRHAGAGPGTLFRVKLPIRRVVDARRDADGAADDAAARAGTPDGGHP